MRPHPRLVTLSPSVRLLGFAIRTRRSLAAAAVAALALAAPAAATAAPLPAGTTAVISGTPDLLGALPAPVGSSENGIQAASRDGRRVVFTSSSDGLVAGVDPAVTNVFVKDTDTGAIELVSRADGIAGEPAHDDCSEAAISADGRRVAFTCDGPLDPTVDTNRDRDVYLRDLATHQTVLVSRVTALGPAGDGASEAPAIDATGSHVAFVSAATNLSGQTIRTSADLIYRRTIGGDDAQAVVSRATGAAGAIPAFGGFRDASISDDGSRVAFDGTSLDPADGGDRLADVYVRDVPGATTTLASRADGANGAAGDGRSTDPLISGDGALVAFRSTSTNFDHSNDPLPDEDIYRRSLGASVTQLISITAAGTKADDDSRPVGIDRTGNDVAFITAADNLDPADAAAHDADVYVRRGFEMVLASRDGGPAGPPTHRLFDAALSGDGTKVVLSLNSDASAGFEPRARGVLLRDYTTGATQLVSRPAGTAPFVNAGGDSSGGSVSADGRLVAFISSARGLGVPDSASSAVLVRDTVTGAVTLASRADGAGGAPLAGFPGHATISGNGRRVAFDLFDPATGGATVHVRDLATGRTFLASRADGADGAAANGVSFAPSISDDGSRIAFRTDATNLGDGDADAIVDIHVRELDSGRTVLVSRATGPAGPKGDRDSADPVISGDGHTVAFDSAATNLTSDDRDPGQDVFVRELDAAATHLVSVRSDGVKGSLASRRPAIDRDGSRVAFISGAPNLGVAGAAQRLWLRDLRAGTTTLAGRADGPDGAPLENSVGSALLSADGTRVAFDARPAFVIAPGDLADRVPRVYERDLDTGANRLIARRTGTAGAPIGPGFGATLAGITADGGCVAFDGRDGTFAPSASPDHSEVYLRAVRDDCSGATGGSGGQSPDRSAPRLSRVRLSARRFRAGGRGAALRATAARPGRVPRGTVLSLRVSEPARLAITVQRERPGRRVRARGGRRICRAVARRPRSGTCVALSLDGRLARTVRAGTTRIALSGRVGRRALAPGPHRLVLTARDSAGNLSRPVMLRFTVVR